MNYLKMNVNQPTLDITRSIDNTTGKQNANAKFYVSFDTVEEYDEIIRASGLDSVVGENDNINVYINLTINDIYGKGTTDVNGVIAYNNDKYYATIPLTVQEKSDIEASIISYLYNEYGMLSINELAENAKNASLETLDAVSPNNTYTESNDTIDTIFADLLSSVGYKVVLTSDYITVNDLSVDDLLRAKGITNDDMPELYERMTKAYPYTAAFVRDNPYVLIDANTNAVREYVSNANQLMGSLEGTIHSYFVSRITDMLNDIDKVNESNRNAIIKGIINDNGYFTTPILSSSDNSVVLDYANQLKNGNDEEQKLYQAYKPYFQQLDMYEHHLSEVLMINVASPSLLVEKKEEYLQIRVDFTDSTQDKARALKVLQNDFLVDENGESGLYFISDDTFIMPSDMLDDVKDLIDSIEYESRFVKLSGDMFALSEINTISKEQYENAIDKAAENIIDDVKKDNPKGLKIYFNYDDVLSEQSFAKYYSDYVDIIEAAKEKGLNLDTDIESFESYLYNQIYDDWNIYEAEDNQYDYVYSNLTKNQQNIMNAYSVKTDSFSNLLRDNGLFCDFDLQDVLGDYRINVLLATPAESKNIDSITGMFTYGEVSNINEYYKYMQEKKAYEYKHSDNTKYYDAIFDNSLAYIIQQQGYSVEDVISAYYADEGTPEPESKFLKSVIQEVNNYYLPDRSAEMVLLTRVSSLADINMLEKIAKEQNEGYLTFSENTMLGLFEKIDGSGSVLEMELEKPLTIPVNMARRIQVEGQKSEWGNYTVDDVYGLVGKAWDGEMAYTSTNEGQEIHLKSSDQIINALSETYNLYDHIVVKCEWSESAEFEDKKIYSISQFDDIMRKADAEKVLASQYLDTNYGGFNNAMKYIDKVDAEVQEDFAKKINTDEYKAFYDANYQNCYDNAFNNIKAEYEVYQENENKRIQAMLDNGEISSPDEFKRFYAEPFDPDKQIYRDRIENTTSQYLQRAFKDNILHNRDDYGEYRNVLEGMGYDKVKFTVYFPDGTSINERQDIGDGYGGLIDFMSLFKGFDDSTIEIGNQAISELQTSIDEHLNTASNALAVMTDNAVKSDYQATVVQMCAELKEQKEHIEQVVDSVIERKYDVQHYIDAKSCPSEDNRYCVVSLYDAFKLDTYDDGTRFNDVRDAHKSAVSEMVKNTSSKDSVYKGYVILDLKENIIVEGGGDTDFSKLSDKSRLKDVYENTQKRLANKSKNKDIIEKD